ncbi:zinc finger MYM-type 3 isoform X1 [Pelobates cultripes]|uniref:Zinc finger MYM-type 3 isoform X1 n=1 Tax=Pelobates cultripes TaxID=61616 RepID=A0AAD1T7Q5_PELCU|nr:zinc finger MYM-type 3 isoform X1 [Pelobates cultripes]
MEANSFSDHCDTEPSNNEPLSGDLPTDTKVGATETATVSRRSLGARRMEWEENSVDGQSGDTVADNQEPEKEPQDDVKEDSNAKNIKRDSKALAQEKDSHDVDSPIKNSPEASHPSPKSDEEEDKDLKAEPSGDINSSESPKSTHAEENGETSQNTPESGENASSLPEEKAAGEPPETQADPPQPSQTAPRRMRLRPSLKPRTSASIVIDSGLISDAGKAPQVKEESPKDDSSTQGKDARNEPMSTTGNDKGSGPSRDAVEQKRSERARRSESLRAEGLASTESMQISDEDSDAMVDDPNDEDFVPFRTRRPTRMSLRNPIPPRPPKPTLTKMSCANCRTPLQKGQTAYQRKGLPQLFCSSACLTTFSKKPLGKKICTFCKKDIRNSKDSVVAQTGAAGNFQEFCSSACLSLFEAQPRSSSQSSSDVPDIIKCSICHKSGEIQHEVSNGSVIHRLCSDICFTKFRATKGLKTNCCDNCGIYIYNKGLPLEYLFHEGQQKRFCNAACLNNYKKKNTKVYPCMYCKTLCKNFEMLSNVDKNGRMGLFCSICCITSHKVKQSGLTGPARPCSLCRRSLSEPAYYNKTDRVLYQFCSPSCWTTFQRTSPEGGIQLNCHYCHNMFTGKPEILDWQDHVYQFCCKDCCEDYKRLHGVVSQCEYCKQEKLLHEKIRFSGVEKNFCSEGCVLLYKQDFTKNLGLCCITCTYCSQTCQRAVTEELDGSTWDFCSEECKSKYLLWYFKAARCHACKRQGKLLETIHWRGEIKHFCNQQCLLRFYSQQNQPNLDTQKGPESLLHSKKGQNAGSKTPTAVQNKAETNTNASRRASERGDSMHGGSRKPVAGNRERTKPAEVGEDRDSLASPKSRTAHAAATPTTPTSPPPSNRKNKAAMCKPLMQNRGTYCGVEMVDGDCQTDEDYKPQVIVLPIPVPIFVPVPMNLYSQKVPVACTMPFPVPVPVLLPTTLENTDKIVETIEELKVKIPSNPLEADILAMAEMIAEAEELDKASDLCAGQMEQASDTGIGGRTATVHIGNRKQELISNQSAEGLLEDCDLFGPARDDVLAMAVKMANVLEEPGQDLEADFPKNSLDINQSVDFLFDCGLVGSDDASEQEASRVLRKGPKRALLSERESCSRDSLSSQRSSTALSFTYGVNAWKSWVQRKYEGGEPKKGEEIRFGPKPMRIKEDILACTAAELNYGLAQFVKEIKRPNGERYEPDSIYYLCLGIQQYLLDNNRMVNIFTDLYYLTFVQELNKILTSWHRNLTPNRLIYSRVEEEHLWDCKQLGVYSPFVLLKTLMFFNTKYFGLRTAEEHMQLSFTNVVRQSRKCTTNRGTMKVVSIRYYPPARQKKESSTKRKREEETPLLEQNENKLNPLRCPVKFYEFYLSKCPENLRNRSDLFYLQPERSCVAESPLWYSVIAMDKSMLQSMLSRILAVREVYEEQLRTASASDDTD